MPRKPDKIKVKDWARIPDSLRDVGLGLSGVDWASNAKPTFGRELEAGIRTRYLDRTALTEEEQELFPRSLSESILRFPSAPIHGLHRVRSYPYDFNSDRTERFHSLRILRSDGFARNSAPTNIYLFHNGLNETDDLVLYYRLASLICDQDPGAVCIVRPFPEHLTRFPFARFSALPLDNYLRDGSLLFRQFLRFMIETRWLLSAIAPSTFYDVNAGASLLLPNPSEDKGRGDDSALARAVRDEWNAMQKASKATLARKPKSHEEPTKKFSFVPVDDDSLIACIDQLRKAVNYERYRRGEGDEDGPPSIHVIGYSLGGFTAQSVFMAWPFLVDTCSTLLSGGALRDLAPTAFSNPEEWQTVLHSLRYELDHAMLSGRFDGAMSSDDSESERQPILGIEDELYFFFLRTFYDVFQQEHSGAYQTRIAAFRQRMLFVVGGNDPIVTPKSVLDSSPPGGMNLLEIGGIGHFLSKSNLGREEESQRRFWLPQVAHVVVRFAGETGKTLLRAVPAEPEDDQGLAVPQMPRLTDQQQLELRVDGALNGELFQGAIDDMLARVPHPALGGESAESGAEKPPSIEDSAAAGFGQLFVLRNEVPSVLLDDKSQYQHARALFHEEDSIRTYVRGLSRRRTFVTDRAVTSNISFVIPHDFEHALRFGDPLPGFPSQAETAPGQPNVELRATADDTVARLVDLVEDLNRDGRAVVRVFDPNKYVEPEGEWVSPPATTLPDAWIWAANDLISEYGGPEGEGGDFAWNAFLNLGTTLRTMERTEREKLLATHARDDRLRVVKVSRARFNPRYMGRLVVEARDIFTVIDHAVTCMESCERLSSSNRAKLRR